MRELSKAQIQYIDNRLENAGIKYWDIRIKMLDHVVSDLEKNALTTNFNNELNSLKRIGWFGDLSHINTKCWQNVDKRYRKEYNNDFFVFFKNVKKILVLLGVLYIGSETNQRILLLIFFLFYFIATYAGYKVNKLAISKVETMHK